MDFSLKAIFGMDATGVKTELKSLRKEMGSFVSDYAKLGAGIAVAAFTALSKGALDLAGDLKHTSESIGVNVESLQALQMQHRANGVSEEMLQKALEKTKAAVIGAANGNATAAASLRALGLQAETLMKLPLDKQYATIAKAAREAKDSNQAYAAVTKIIGEDVGPKLVASLRELGERGLPAVTKSAREAGQVMSAETIVALERAGTAIDDFKRRATVAVGNILVNFNSAAGLQLLGMQLLKVLGQFGGGILDAISEANSFAGAVFRGTFRGLANFFQDALVGGVEIVAKAINKVLPSRFEINIGNLEQFRSSGQGVADAITEAIAKTEPSTIRKSIGEAWDENIAKQQKIVDALNKRDFGVDAKKMEEAGTHVAKKIQESSEAIVQGGVSAGREISRAAQTLGAIVGELRLAINRTGNPYDQQSTTALQGVQSRLRSQRDALANDRSYSSAFAPGAKNPMFYAIQAELASVEKELAERKRVNDYANQFGEQAARYQFGDTATNKALQDLTQDTTRTAGAVEAIRSQLSKVLG